MKDGVHIASPQRHVYTQHTCFFHTSMTQHTHPPYALSTLSTPSASPPLPPQVLLDELEGAVQGLPDHDPDDDAWRPLHQFIVIVKVWEGEGGMHGIMGRAAAGAGRLRRIRVMA